MKSIFLRPQIKQAVREHHREIVASVQEFGDAIEERVCLYDLLLAPGERIDKDRWAALQLHWAEALSQPVSVPLDTLGLHAFYLPHELAIKKSLFPFLAQMRRKSLWRAITSPDPEPDELIDLTRWTVHWAALLAVKKLWLYKTKTERWSAQDYVGMPAMTTPALNCAAILFGECVRGSVIQAKTVHTRIATEIGRSEIYANSALHVMGQGLR